MILKLLLNTTMIRINKNIEEYNPNKKIKTMTLLPNNKKPNPIVTDFFIRGRRPNKSLVFIIQSYFACQKKIRVYSTNENFNRSI